MKKFLLLLLLCAIAMPVWAQEEQEITPETVIYIQDGDVIRVMTVEEVQGELDTYDDTLKTNSYAYEENGTLYIPMHPDDVAALKAQESIDAYEEEYETRGQSFSKEYKEEWGIKKYFSAFIDAAMTVDGDASNRALNGHFYAGGYVFTKEFRILEFDANIVNNNPYPEELSSKSTEELSSRSTASASLKILGATVWSASQDLYWEWTKVWDPLFSHTWRFMVGPIPVSVTASISGELRLWLGIELYEDGLGIEGDVIPGATLTGKVDACVDILIVKVGVEGSIEFIKVDMKFAPHVAYIPETGINIGLKIKLRLEALKGQISIIVEINLFLKKKKWTFKLWDWEGIKKNYVLYDKDYPED